jgi:hypothetical protein
MFSSWLSYSLTARGPVAVAICGDARSRLGAREPEVISEKRDFYRRRVVIS